jgi:THO complex subunit 1
MAVARDESYGIEAVARFSSFLKGLLAQAAIVKGITSIEPSLEKSQFPGIISNTMNILPQEPAASLPDEVKSERKAHRFAVVETPVRDLFSNVIVSHCSLP